MTQEVQYTATPRRPQWQDLSDEHTRVRAALQAALRQFAEGRGVRVKSIVGAYGSGKSELMAWGFHHCWTALGIPALVLNAEQLLEQLPLQMSPGDLADAMNEFAQAQLAHLADAIDVKPLPDNILLATDFRSNESAAEYLFELFDDQEATVEALREMLHGQRAVIFLDEIEQKYGELLERVESSDRAPLRELLQRVEHGQTSFYIVLSFGLTSAYEAISGAEARRMDTLTLPIPEPRSLGRLANLAGYENLIWWASRGRPGWAVKLANDWGASLEQISGLEQFNQLQPNTIENLPIVNSNGFPEALSSGRMNELATQLLKRLGPAPRTSLKLSQPAGDESTNLPRHQVLLVVKEEDLLAVSDLVDAFVQDLMEQAVKLDIPNVDLARLRLYLRTVLISLADAAGRVVFGGPRKVEWLAKAAIAPTLTLVIDLLLEFEGDHPEALSVLNLLDKVMGTTGVVGDDVQDPYRLVDHFRRVEELFVETRTFPETAWISLSPKTIEALFPRIVGRPLLTLSPKAKRTLDEQRAAVEAAVAAGAPVLTSKHHRDKTEVTFIFVPDETSWTRVRAGIFDRDRRRTYLHESQLYSVVPLNHQGTIDVAVTSAFDDAAILHDLEKLQRNDLQEKRLEDFMVSLWHHALTEFAGNGTQLNLNDVLLSALKSEGLSKSNRRKLEHYRERVTQRLEDLASGSVPQYRRSLRRLFDVEDERFPTERLEETRRRVRENRTIEQVALALDMVEHLKPAVTALGELRELKLLRRETSQPHAYEEFLENYTVVAHPAPGPGAGLSEMVEYIDSRGAFDHLRELAGRLALAPPEDFADAQQATENAPLLVLFHDVTVAQGYFLRGLSLHRYLENNRDRYEAVAADLQADVRKVAERLDALAQKVEELNCDLDFSLLSTKNLNSYATELRNLDLILSTANELPAATLYVVVRFTSSAVVKVEELQQRWASEQGLEGWRAQLGPLIGWHRAVEGIAEELDSMFTNHTELKANILGSREFLKQQLSQQLSQQALAVLEKVEQENELLLGARRLAAPEYQETLTAVRGRLDDLHKQAETIDALVERKEKLLDQTMALVNSFVEAETHAEQ